MSESTWQAYLKRCHRHVTAERETTTWWRRLSGFCMWTVSFAPTIWENVIYEGWEGGGAGARFFLVAIATAQWKMVLRLCARACVCEMFSPTRGLLLWLALRVLAGTTSCFSSSTPVREPPCTRGCTRQTSWLWPAVKSEKTPCRCVSCLHEYVYIQHLHDYPRDCESPDDVPSCSTNQIWPSESIWWIVTLSTCWSSLKTSTLPAKPIWMIWWAHFPSSATPLLGEVVKLFFLCVSVTIILPPNGQVMHNRREPRRVILDAKLFKSLHTIYAFTLLFLSMQHDRIPFFRILCWIYFLECWNDLRQECFGLRAWSRRE